MADASVLSCEEMEHRVKVALAEIGKPHAFMNVTLNDLDRPVYWTIKGVLTERERWLLRETVTVGQARHVCWTCYPIYRRGLFHDQTYMAAETGCFALERPFTQDCGRDRSSTTMEEP